MKGTALTRALVIGRAATPGPAVSRPERSPDAHGRFRSRTIRLSWIGALSLAVLLVAAAAPPTAAALSHNWAYGQNSNCSSGHVAANTRCYDAVSTPYHSWLETATTSYSTAGVDAPAAELCTKAITEAGNIRSTTDGGAGAHEWCDYGHPEVHRCLVSATPLSWAYGYWNNSTTRYISGHAQTTISELCP